MTVSLEVLLSGRCSSGQNKAYHKIFQEFSPMLVGCLVKDRNVNEPLKLSVLAALVCAQPKCCPKCAVSSPAALCNMSYLSNQLHKRHSWRWMLHKVNCKGRSRPCHRYLSPTQLFDILGHCVTGQLGFISLWHCNFIPYTVLKPRVVESKHKFSFIGTMPAQPFYPQEISLEREWEDRTSRHRVTECQTARNSQLVLLAPSGPTCGCGTQGGGPWLRSHYVLQLNNTGLRLSTWEGSLVNWDPLAPGDTGGNRAERLLQQPTHVDSTAG